MGIRRDNMRVVYAKWILSISVYAILILNLMLDPEGSSIK